MLVAVISAAGVLLALPRAAGVQRRILFPSMNGGCVAMTVANTGGSDLVKLTRVVDIASDSAVSDTCGDRGGRGGRGGVNSSGGVAAHSSVAGVTAVDAVAAIISATAVPPAPPAGYVDSCRTRHRSGRPRHSRRDRNRLQARAGIKLSCITSQPKELF